MQQTNTTAQIAPAARVLHALALFIVCLLLAWCSIVYTRVSGGTSLVWMNNGLLVGLLVLRPLREWTDLLAAATLGSVIARAANADPAGSNLLVSCANVIECLIVAGAARWHTADVRDVGRLRDLALVATTSTLVGCAISGALAVSARSDHSLPWFSAWTYWYAAHVLGMVVIATLELVAATEGRRLLGAPGRRVELVAGLGVVAATTYGVFAQSEFPLLFIVFVPQLWLTFREGWRGVVLGTPVVALISGVLTANGTGPLYAAADMSLIQRALLLQFFIGTLCAVTWPIAIIHSQRAQLSRELRRREAMYRLLTTNQRDLIVHLRADGKRLYVSESARDLLGWEPQELMEPRWDLVHPDDRDAVRAAFARAFTDAQVQQITFRLEHKQGHYVWIEALTRRVESSDAHALPEIVYSGRDVSARVCAEQAGTESQRRLQAVADNVPALIAHVDPNGVYTFANSAVGEMFSVAAHTLVGRTVRETMGERDYAAIAPHVVAALCGERVTYERVANVRGEQRDYEVTFVPDVLANSEVNGFFALSYDITERKRSEAALDRLARVDTLTGLANRREFQRRLEAALANTGAKGLLLIDVDHFKTINDSHGHAAGDAVLVSVAQRLHSCVFDLDLVARLGGDEFAILIEQNVSTATLEQVAARIIKAMSRAIHAEGTLLWVTLSVGATLCEGRGASEKELFGTADRALYSAKAAGRNTYRIALAFDED
jgi:diguanylate cyclase (GGDEF)-like protein/PAS domain S-box-containing protein